MNLTIDNLENRIRRIYYRGRSVNSIYLGKKMMFPSCVETAMEKINRTIDVSDIPSEVGGEIDYGDLKRNMMRRVVTDLPVDSTGSHLEFSEEAMQQWTDLVDIIMEDVDPDPGGGEDEPETATITWDLNDGSVPTSSRMEVGGLLEKPSNPERRGYEFQGWNPEVPEDVPGEDTTFTAQWVPVEYAIQYDMDGHGSIPSGVALSYTIESGEYEPETPDPVEGWMFTGWTPEKIPVGSVGNVTFKANWFESGEETRIVYSSESGLPPVNLNVSELTRPENIPNSEEMTEIYIGTGVTEFYYYVF